MSKYVSVADSYVIYEVQDEVVEVLSGGNLAQPPMVIMELLVLNGTAKRIGNISTSAVGLQMMEGDEDDEDEDPEEGAGPWIT